MCDGVARNEKQLVFVTIVTFVFVIGFANNAAYSLHYVRDTEVGM